MQVYLPGPGWVDFDPTSGSVGKERLVTVAVAHDPQHTLPLHGTYLGFASNSLGMDVKVFTRPHDSGRRRMKIRVGYELIYDFPQATPMIVVLGTHFQPGVGCRRARFSDHQPGRPDLALPRRLRQLVQPLRRSRGPDAPLGDGTVRDTGVPDVVAPSAPQQPIDELPDETIVFLLGRRYCETDRLSEIAWSLFGNAPTGWGRVQAICDFVHDHITFGYEHARATRTAWEAYKERPGVCRDYAHLAIAFCRCMNIPARYCTGYLGDIGMPPPYGPMDFAGWFEAFSAGAGIRSTHATTCRASAAS